MFHKKFVIGYSLEVYSCSKLPEYMALKKAYRRFKKYSVIYKELAENLLSVFSITRKAMQLKETVSMNKELKVLLSLKGILKKTAILKTIM